MDECCRRRCKFALRIYSLHDGLRSRKLVGTRLRLMYDVDGDLDFTAEAASFQVVCRAFELPYQRRSRNRINRLFVAWERFKISLPD